jgi:hypothetical protein
MLINEKAQWIYLAKVRVTELVNQYNLKGVPILVACIECLESIYTTDAQAEKILSFIVEAYCLDEVPVPIIIPNIPNLPLPTYGAGAKGDPGPQGPQGPAGPAGISTFPIGTPNVNVAVGGWNVGYVLSGVEVIDALIDLGVQFIPPSTTLTFTSLVQSTSLAVSGNNIERGAIITAITVNRVRNLGSDTFVSGLYTQPNLADVTDNAGTPNPRSFTGASITASNTAISGGIPVHVITLLTDYGTSPNETDTVSINFVSPVYFGVLPLASTTNAAAIQGLGKASLANNQFRTGLSFTPSSNRIVYAYPSRFPDLTNITDGNGFPALPNFITPPSIVTLTFPNAPSETYKVYVYSTDVSPSTVVFNFIA